MNTTVSFQHVILLFFIAFLLRACVMFFAIAPHNFYKQADSGDYHNCAISIATGHGMHRVDNAQPIFWRTPGYPLFLACFYYCMGIHHHGFDQNCYAQLAALWLQIIFASSIPIILLYLALLLTSSTTIAFITAWISVFHPGFILASTYLLTEGLALIFFYLFLLFLYKNCVRSHASFFAIAAAALYLSMYTWMRPMGEFIGYVTAILIFFGGIGSWVTTAKKSLLFLFIFCLSLVPWYWRNYHLTNELFFCPTIGNYLNCFSVPKILRRTLQKPLLECHTIAQQNAGREAYYRRRVLQGTNLHVSPTISKIASFPIVMHHPFYFMYDWLQEVIKTTFDLYTYQIVPMLNGTYWYDPIEEFLPDKIADCLYAQQMPWYLRLVSWMEFLVMIVMWIGLFGGFLSYIVKPIFSKSSHNTMLRIWLLCIPMIGIIIGMTGGFGYARLRLPAEPLLIILSLTFFINSAQDTIPRRGKKF